MEILTYKKIYQLVGDAQSGTNECIVKSQAVSIANSYRKNVTSNLSGYLDNEYIDVFSVEDKPDLSKLVFSRNLFSVSALESTLATYATSLDIDGNTISYAASADVDWITNISIVNADIKFRVSANGDGLRVGHITGTNASGKSDTITVTQEAYVAPLKFTYTLVAKGAQSAPTMTVNSLSVTPTLDGSGNYIYEYFVRVSKESDAPESIPFTINNGGAGSQMYDRDLYVYPTSWELNPNYDGGLSKEFSVSYKVITRENEWSKLSGSIPRGGSITTLLNTSFKTDPQMVDYLITDDAKNGASFSYDLNVSSFTATASGYECGGSTIAVSYNGYVKYIDVTYTSDEYTLSWDDGTTTKSSSVGNNSGSLTATANGTKNGTEYNPTISAESDSSWITTSVDCDTVTISYERNDGDSRTGVVTVKDSHGNTIIYNVAQSSNSWSHTYTLIATGANSTPTMTIAGLSITPIKNGDTYTGVYTVNGDGEDASHGSVSWTISGGVPSTSWGRYSMSVSPSSWNLADGLSNNIYVSMIQNGTSYSWWTTSGTIRRDDTATTYILESDTSYKGTKYSVTVPNGIVYAKHDTSNPGISAGASTISATGDIVFTCTESDAMGETATCKVYYEPSSVDYTYTVNVTCPEKPTIKIDGEAATVTGSGSSWIGTRVISSTTDPGEKGYSVSAGSSSKVWKDVNISVDPINNTITSVPGSFSFTAYASQDYIAYSAYSYSGTTNNKTATCTPTRSSESGKSLGETCTISSSSNISGIATSTYVSASGTTISGTASGSGTVTVSYRYDSTYNGSATYTLTYSKPADPVYEFYITPPGTSNKVTSYTIGIGANGEYDTQDADYSITSTKDGEGINYSITSTTGEVGGYNYSESVKEKTVVYTQNESKKDVSIIWSQSANVKEWKNNSDALKVNFPYIGGTKTVSSVTWFVWKYRENSWVPTYNSIDRTITTSENTSTESKTWTEEFTQDGMTVTVTCTQDGKPEDVITYKYRPSVTIAGLLSNISNDTTITVPRDGVTCSGSSAVIYKEKYINGVFDSKEIDSTKTVNITTESSWITYSKGGLIGGGGQSGAVFAFNKNESSYSSTNTLRIGLISISGGDSDCNFTITAQQYSQYNYTFCVVDKLGGEHEEWNLAYDSNGNAGDKIFSIRSEKTGLADDGTLVLNQDVLYTMTGSLPSGANTGSTQKSGTATYTLSESGKKLIVTWTLSAAGSANKTITISNTQATNTATEANFTFSASEEPERNIMITFEFDYASNGSIKTESGVCTIPSGSKTMSTYVVLGNATVNTVHLSSYGASPLSYPNSNGGVTTIKCGQ